MSEPKASDDQALKRLSTRLDALAASSQRTPRRFDVEGGAGAGYRLIAELIGGVLVGLGLGWVLDRFAGTSPFGLIGGVLIGSGLSIFVVVRSAGRMSNAAKAGAEPPAPPVSADVEGKGFGSTGADE